MKYIKHIIYYLVLLLVLLAGLLLIYFFHWDLFNPLQSRECFIDKQERSFSFHIPDGLVAHPKLVFVLHGSRTGPRIMQYLSGHGFDKQADLNKDAIIVYPAAFKGYWNDCRKAGTYASKKEEVDELTFFRAMITFFAKNYCIDTTFVFAVGASGGGQMCFKLAKEMPECFRGFAAISANLPVETNDDCRESRQPVSMLIMNGTADPVNPYEGGEMHTGEGESRGGMCSTEQTILYWRKIAHCDSVSSVVKDISDLNQTDHSTIKEFSWKSPLTGKEIRLMKVVNGGHTIPNTAYVFWPGKLGNVNRDADAATLIMQYFKNLN